MLVNEPKRSNHGNDGEESSDDPSDLGSISVYMTIWESKIWYIRGVLHRAWVVIHL